MEDGVLKAFKHIMYSTPAIWVWGKPWLISQEDWDFAVAALLAMAED